jgi:hypothetical protein
MTQLLAQALRDRINARIILLDIPFFLQEEVDRFLQYVHYYKLKNIEKHLDVFCDYLLYLDKDYTVQLISYLQKGDIAANTFAPDGVSEEHMSYYLSAYGKDTIQTAQLLPMLVRGGFDTYTVLTMMLCVKWLFLLTATEFCHASSTRISLYDRLLTSVRV